MAGIETGLGGIWQRKKFTIPATSSLVIHTIALTKFHSVDYNTSVYNDANNKNKSLNIKAHNVNSTSISKSVYAKIGQMNITFVFSVVSGNMLLTATNNEAFEVKLEYGRLVLGS